MDSSVQMKKVKNARTISCCFLSTYPNWAINDSSPSTTISIAIPIRTGGARSKTLFKKEAYKIPISSTKSMIGHALGGAGALEAVACVSSILNNEIHPTINYQDPDPLCDLRITPNQSLEAEISVVLSNSFGLGGQNAAALFRRIQD